MEERARGSWPTTIGRVVQSKTPEPETLSVLQYCLRVVLFLSKGFIGPVLVPVVSFTTYQSKIN